MSNKAAPLEGDVIPPIVNVGMPSDKQIERTLDKAEGMIANKKMAVVEAHARLVLDNERIVKFKRRLMILVREPYTHYVVLTKERFDNVAYPLIGGISRSQVADIFAYMASVADDFTSNSHLIGFGQNLDDMAIEADTNLAFFAKNRPVVWDTRALTLSVSEELDHTIWRSPYPRIKTDTDNTRVPFIMQLAGDDEGLYDDIMQSLAPMIMDKKPDGVIWWVGTGANGKSTLMDALYRIFPGQLASINVKRLTDGRDTPSLNGRLANIVKESSEGRVDDTEIYKALGTHENFRVHKFHSQEDLEIDGNMHTIFSANAIPTFSDKGYSARRRTFIIPFIQRFDSDPDFERKTFTPEFFGSLISEMFVYAHQLKKQNYKYKWSAKTLNAKTEYDKEANNAEEYAAELINQGVVAFESYNPVKTDYDNWCADEGYVPLGIGNLRKALTALGFERSSKTGGHVYKLPNTDTVGLENLSVGRPGLYTTAGFAPEEPTKIDVPEFDEPEESILNNKW